MSFDLCQCFLDNSSFISNSRGLFSIKMFRCAPLHFGVEFLRERASPRSPNRIVHQQQLELSSYSFARETRRGNKEIVPAGTIRGASEQKLISTAKRERKKYLQFSNGNGRRDEGALARARARARSDIAERAAGYESRGNDEDERANCPRARERDGRPVGQVLHM